jgi:uncharacterized membrane protein YqhA
MIEKIFESILWKSRFFTIFAVIFGMLGAIILFIVASIDIIGAFQYAIAAISSHPDNFHEVLVGIIIGAVDLYLIAIVMILFSFGVYELFISEIDVASGSENKILAIHSLDQLKDKIAKVIVMVLIVSFFKRVLHTQYNSALDMLYFAISICVLSIGLYFLGKVGKK